MTIPEELKKLIRWGDYKLIAEMYKERHATGYDADYRTVSTKYVQMVIDGDRDVTPGKASEEIIDIATRYLEHKRNFIDELLTA